MPHRTIPHPLRIVSPSQGRASGEGTPSATVATLPGWDPPGLAEVASAQQWLVRTPAEEESGAALTPHFCHTTPPELWQELSAAPGMCSLPRKSKHHFEVGMLLKTCQESSRMACCWLVAEGCSQLLQSCLLWLLLEAAEACGLDH